jgi:beta-barrel assembly-enhancing protease
MHKQRLAVVLLLTSVGGCAGLETRPPMIAPEQVSLERARLQNDAIKIHISRTKNLLDLAWPLLQKNADLCGKKSQQTIGVRLFDAKMLAPFVQGLRRSDVEALGWNAKARIGLVVAGGPAERAGLRDGDQIVAVNGEKIPADSGAVKTARLIAAQIKNSKAGSVLDLTVSQGPGLERNVSVTPETICAFPLVLDRSGSVNAQTDGKRLTLFLGLVRAETDPRRVQFVIAHELAHAMLRHPQKSIRNSIVSGGAVVGTVAATGGWLLDTVSYLAGKKPTVSYQRQGAGLATWPYGRDFEREADYVGLYAMARAGLDVSGVEEIFTTFARESPSGTWLALTHPSSPERWLAVRATQAEIADKQEQGLPLLPNGWKAKTDSPARSK